MFQAVGDAILMRTIYSCHTLFPLVPDEHRLNATAYLSIIADYVHSCMTTVYPSSHDCFQQDKKLYHKAQIISNWFPKNDLHSHQISIQQSTFGIRWTGSIKDVQQLCHAIMSIWIKISAMFPAPY